MKAASFTERLAVCSWSLQPPGPQALVEQLKAAGIPRVQIALDPIRADPDRWGQIGELCTREGIQIVSGMLATVGEDYSTMESIRRTGGLVPDSTWEENWKNVQVIADLASRVGLGLVTFHAGFLAHDETDPEYAKLLNRIRLVADVFAKRGIELGFETGQESAATLIQFLKNLGRPNVGVNFDPANMILYDQGDPIPALRELLPWLKQCHIKDARRTRRPGTWGDEVVVGTGEVDWQQFFQVLNESQFGGWLCIEREAGDHRLGDIQTARRYVESLVQDELSPLD